MDYDNFMDAIHILTEQGTDSEKVQAMPKAFKKEMKLVQKSLLSLSQSEVENLIQRAKKR